MTRDEFRRKLATADGRTDLGLSLTAEQAAVCLADDVQLDALYTEHVGRITVPTAAPRSPRLSRPEKKALYGFGGLITVVVIAAVIVGAVRAHQPPADDAAAAVATDAPYAAPTPERAYPLISGYTDAGNGLEWTFGDVNADPNGCSYYDSCVVVNVQAFADCPSGVYVEGQVLDASGVVIGMANDTLPSLSKGQQGRVKLGYMGKGASKFRVTEVTCN